MILKLMSEFGDLIVPFGDGPRIAVAFDPGIGADGFEVQSEGYEQKRDTLR